MTNNIASDQMADVRIRRTGTDNPGIPSNHSAKNGRTDKGKINNKTATAGNKLYRHESDKLKAQIRQQMLKMRQRRENAAVTSENTATNMGITNAGIPSETQTTKTPMTTSAIIHTVADSYRACVEQSSAGADMVSGEGQIMPRSSSRTPEIRGDPPTNTSDVPRQPGYRHSVAAPYGTYSLPRNGTPSGGVHRTGYQLSPSADISRSMPCLVSGGASVPRDIYTTYRPNELVLDPTAFRTTIGAAWGLNRSGSEPCIDINPLQGGECSESSV
jgi:hypothetical protein